MDTCLKPARSRAAAGRRFSSFLLVALAVAACHRSPPSDEHEGAAETKQVRNGVVLLPEGDRARSSLAVDVARKLDRSVLSVNGRLVWDDNSTVRVYTPVAGRVTAIPVELGAEVKEGQELAAIFRRISARRRQMPARPTPTCGCPNARSTACGICSSHGAAAAKDVEAAEDDFEYKQAELNRAVGRLTLYGGTLGSGDGMYRLKAPLPGIIVEKPINPGQEVRPDALLANVANTSCRFLSSAIPTKLWVMLDVTELDINRCSRARNSRSPPAPFQTKL